MSYFPTLRQDFILWRLACKGEVQRADVARTFGISIPQASADINALLTERPDAASYDKTRRRYVPCSSHAPPSRLVRLAAALEWT